MLFELLQNEFFKKWLKLYQGGYHCADTNIMIEISHITPNVNIFA